MRAFSNSLIVLLCVAVRLRTVVGYCWEPELCVPGLPDNLDDFISECEASFPLAGATDQAGCPEDTELATNLTSACFCHLVSRDPTLAVDTLDSDGTTWLHLVADEGDYQMTKCLIKNGADANATLNDEVDVPLFRAAVGSEAEASCATAALVLDGGADVQLTKDGFSTAFVLATRGDNYQTMDVLLVAGSDINARNSQGGTVAYLAAFRGRVDLLRYLVARCLDLAAVNNLGRTALDLAATASTFNRDVVEALLRPGDPSLDIPFPFEDGATPLVYLAGQNETELVRLLIEAGADVNKADDSGNTPLSVAIEIGNGEIAAMLRAAGAAEPTAN